MHPDLAFAKQFIYDRGDYSCTAPIAEKESSDYGAYTFTLNQLAVKFRAAKITPKKVGQFVTLWIRDAAGITQPHSDSDSIDIAVISVRKEQRLGQFVFPKAVLIQKGILSTSKKEGKRGFRVYPPWDLAENKQAQKTQQWQLDFFVEINTGELPDVQRFNFLYQQR